MSGQQPNSSNEKGDLPFAPTLRKALIMMVVGFAVPILILLVIVYYINGQVPAAPSEAVAAASSAPAAPASAAPAASAPKAASAASGAAPAVAADSGKKTYDATCAACHSTGVAGAPKLGDKAAWAPRIATGVATLDDHALHGFTGKAGTMPPKGGGTAADADVKAAVDYMVSQSK